ncbi:SymE family type I addiction module toxin [Dyadobacter crusticola]|uniref:SymE family type I addiction module toxin n=1 Tax=Dyadobacter crusticola TaxID=292407 RepID=UPI00054FC184|nr:SymE family type I addiction module toxin [Dyadobacter crusticola]
MRPTDKKKDSKQNQDRILTIQKKYRQRTYGYKGTPEIRLCGEWLRRLGFEDGNEVIVTMRPELLVIKLAQ